MLNKRLDPKINSLSIELNGVPSYNKILLNDLNEPGRSSELISDKLEELNAALIKEVNELKKDNLELNRVLDNVDECIYSVDATTYQFINVSMAAEKVYGYTAAEFYANSKLWYELIIPEDKIIIDSTNEKLYRGEWALNQFRITHKDGSIRWLESKVMPIFDEQRKLIRLDGVVRDITEKKESELKIIENEKKYRYLFENNPLPLWVMEAGTFKFLDVNSAAISHYGYTREEFLSLTALELRTEDERERLLKFQKENANKISNYGTGVWKHIKKDGTVISVDVIRHEILFEGKRALLILINDITEKLKAQQSLQKSEANLLTILNSTNISYILMDAELGIVSYNQIAYDAFKTELGKPLAAGEKIIDYFLADDIGNTINYFKKVMNGEQVSYEGTFAMQSGVIMWYNMQLTPVIDNNHVLGMIMAIKDITANKMAELEREKITADLIQRNNDLEQFTYIISHNLRSPVANIMGFAEALVHEELGETEKKAVAVGLFDSVHRLDSVIFDLNNILKVKSEISELKESVKLSSIVNDIKANSYRLIEKENAVIKTDFIAIDELFTLKSYIHSIFFNLISNGIKYRKAGVNPVIEIKSAKLNDKIILSFKDNGMGIDITKRGKQVFGLYKRFHTHVEGKGMGLFMVKTQVEALGGKISIQSDVNKGTEFIIEFNL